MCCSLRLEVHIRMFHPGRDRCLQAWPCDAARSQVSHIEAFLLPCHTESIAWSRCCFLGFRAHHLRSRWRILLEPHTRKSFNLNLNIAKRKGNVEEAFAHCLLLCRLKSKYVSAAQLLEPVLAQIISGSSSSHHQEFPYLRGGQALHTRGLSLAL